MEEDIELTIKRTPRQIFANWKRTKEYVEVIKDLLAEQLYMCPSCKKVLNYSKMHVHHMYPLSLIKTTDQYKLITNKSNLILLCSKCNLTQSNKIDNRFY